METPNRSSAEETEASTDWNSVSAPLAAVSSSMESSAETTGLHPKSNPPITSNIQHPFRFMIRLILLLKVLALVSAWAMPTAPMSIFPRVQLSLPMPSLRSPGINPLPDWSGSTRPMPSRLPINKIPANWSWHIAPEWFLQWGKDRKESPTRR